MSVGAVVLAAGRSERFGRDKLTLDLEGKPVWRRSFEAFLHHPEVDLVGLVVPQDRLATVSKLAPEAAFVVAGGDSRQKSARRGVEAMPDHVEWVLIHDAARPFVSGDLISRTLAAAARVGGACPGLPLSDTVKRRDGDRWSTIERSSLVAVQTPQVGRRADFLRAHAEADVELTDDMALLERIGIPVEIVPGDAANVKLTMPGDLERTRRPEASFEIRTGLGYDIHAFSSDLSRRMIVGGVEFEDRPGLEGHSDADALIHAIVDALLGAAGLGDIGTHYPNTDPRWKNASSVLFLRESGELLRSAGWEISHVDCSVLAERPKIMPRRQEICDSIAQALQLDSSRVSVKATTNEKLGAIGRGEGLAAFAVATIRGRPRQGDDNGSTGSER